ncbi:hypothetical protein VB620_11000 [Nodularia harveyana UHCC-0300]|uniref:Uncharacterized protein n=1 Tax=Nodularia harveyana UHCC-0300 TaxID=2974287 RepID=A0ABU5UEB0_9CYAN|nr:hypothetical protein [Nodularia harveyana]MEA5581864.1 hypothetical protein [Nodularia harveyana UHCC-0300]
MVNAGNKNLTACETAIAATGGNTATQCLGCVRPTLVEGLAEIGFSPEYPCDMPDTVMADEAGNPVQVVFLLERERMKPLLRWL